MGVLYHVCLVLHLAAMAVWFGVPLTQLRRLKQALATDDAAAKTMMDNVARETKIVIAAASTTLLTGLALAAQIGFANVQTRFWVGLGITLFMQISGGIGFGGTHKKIGELVNAGKRSEAMPLTKRLAAMSGVHQLLWLTNVILMTWR